MRFLAIDLGTRRIGLAVGDDRSRLASPLEVIEVSSPAQAIDRVIAVVRSEAMDHLVLGLPMNMDGTLGPAAKSTIEWGKQLSSRAGVPLIFVDERLSSFAAEDQLSARRRAGEKLTRGRKKQQRDALAAAAFLQDYLDGRLAAIDVVGMTRS
jgi:putative Holliday junction resolvase